MPHFFDRRDFLGNSPAVWIAAVLLFLTPVAWWSAKQTRIENDVAHWLPDDDPQIQKHAWTRQQFAADEHISVSWTGSSLNDPRVDRFLEQLEPEQDANGVRRGGSPYVADVIDPRALLTQLRANGVEAPEVVRRLQGIALGSGPLRIRLTESARPRTKRWLQELPKLAKQELGIDLTVEPSDTQLANAAALPSFTTTEGEELPAQSPVVLDSAGKVQNGTSIEHDLAVTWPGMQPGTDGMTKVVEWLSRLKPLDPRDGVEPVVAGSFFVPGSPVVLAVALSDAGRAEPIEALNEIRNAAQAAGISRSDLKLAGRALDAIELDRQVAAAAWNPAFAWTQLPQRSALLALVLVATIVTLVMLRSVGLTSVTLIGGLLAAFYAIAVIPATGGTINAMLMLLPGLILLVTLAATISVVNQSSTGSHSIGPCCLGGLTMMLGLGALSLSSLSPLRDFGLYAALGVVIVMVMAVWAVPGLLKLLPSRPGSNADLDHPVWRAVGQRLVRRPKLQATFVLMICLAGSIGLIRFQTASRLLHDLPQSTAIADNGRFLEDQIAGLATIETIVRFDERAQQQANFLDRMEMVRDIEESLRNQGAVTGCLALADWLPYTEPLPDGASRLVASRYHKRASAEESRVREGELAGANGFYAVADADHILTTSTRQELCHAGDELWRITGRVKLTASADYAAILKDLDQRTQDVLRYQPGASHLIAGAAPVMARTQQAAFISLITAVVVAAVAALLVMILHQRSIAAGLLAMIVNAAPIAFAVGLLSLAGEAFDAASVMALVCVLGLTVMNTLSILASLQQHSTNGLSRQAAVAATVMQCGPAIWQSGVILTLASLPLMPVELTLLSRFGTTFAALITATTMGHFLLWPQILATPVGELFVHRPPQSEADHQRIATKPPHIAEIDAAA